MPWYINSDQLLSVDGLSDPVTGAYVNNASVTATMYEADGVTEVQGVTWPLTVSYVSSSNGNYNGVLDDSRVLVEGNLYWIEVEADAGNDLIKTWRWRDVARYGTPDD